jgi:hypothetical protein
MPYSMADIQMNPGERGTILGKTQTGKSTLAMALIQNWRDRYPKSFVLIADTKPNFRGTHEIDGRTTKQSRRYSRDDWGDNAVIPDSVVLPLKNPRGEIRMAMQLRYNCAIAQIRERNRYTIMPVSDAIRAAYELRPKGKPLLLFIDEGNNFFRDAPQAARWPIITAITSGATRHVAVLFGAQRPRNISVEAVESLTKIYWFHFPVSDDVKHLKSMGVPPTAHPAQNYYEFYFYDNQTRKEIHRAHIKLNDEVYENGYRGQQLHRPQEATARK